MKIRFPLIIAAVLLLAACAPTASPTPAVIVPPVIINTEISTPVSSETPVTVSTDTPSSSPDPEPSSSVGASSGEVEIEIEDFAFTPSTVTIKAGSTVKWGNKDNVSHTVTSDDGTWGSGSLAKGDKFSFTFSQPGTYSYHCGPHPSMKATIIVVAP